MTLKAGRYRSGLPGNFQGGITRVAAANDKSGLELARAGRSRFRTVRCKTTAFAPDID
jgi:hypothetical protein